MKLCILCKKVNADFLGTAKSSKIRMAEVPVTFTYEEALAVFRNEVNSKFPPELSSNTNRTRRQLQENGRQAGRGYRGGRGGGRSGGRGGRGGRGGAGSGCSGQRRQREDSTFIVLTDGIQVVNHPSFYFPPDIYRRMTQGDKARLKSEHAAYRRQRQAQTTDQRVIQQQQQHQPRISQQQQQPPPVASIAGTTAQQADELSHISQSMHHTMMGGRNKQAFNNNRHMSVVSSHRRIATLTNNASCKEPQPNISAANECDTNKHFVLAPILLYLITHIVQLTCTLTISLMIPSLTFPLFLV
jgi:hypothetical protein